MKMVCLSYDRIVAKVRDDIATSSSSISSTLSSGKESTIELFPDLPVDNIFSQIAKDFNYEANDVKLTLSVAALPSNGISSQNIELNSFKGRSLKDIGLSFEESCKPTIIIHYWRRPSNIDTHLNLSSSSSLSATTTTTTTTGCTALLPASDTLMLTASSSSSSTTYMNSHNASSSSNNYVGLVNQAMTCYLNSLLQALYMTPEFRNALYNWEFDGSNPANSIPFQLQRLFLNLQTSSRSAVETTDLTQSFGWNMQQAWEQHDIQELCRVMFDALEHKFKDTERANLINDLYEGRMLDYVTCLECKTEKSREDTFLDIPLPVKPFGSTVAYNSIEEALRAFVQPETLDGNNQYFCEKCNKKCDAHKGLKFTKFPYLLTLHLKRFDFDYNTMNRIKLNDKVVFPEKLNLNSFIADCCNNSAVTVNGAMEEREGMVKCDDCSTTDSGSALDDESCHGTDVSSLANGPDENGQDDDEGIDVSSGGINNHHENEKNRLQDIQGPYFYDLFSIMIHSGSASGGHYYAYIKDFSKNQWFCFNDQSVTRITENDIEKTYGGGPQRGYYSGAYTSSTNAYMLMYRQIDKERNCEALSVEEFPPHIKSLLQEMRDNEENEKRRKEEENDSVKIKIHCRHPLNNLCEEKLLVFYDTRLGEATSDAYDKFKLKDLVNLEDCRLVAYHGNDMAIVNSFESDALFFEQIAKQHTEFLLEIKKPGTKFDEYSAGGVQMKVYLIDVEMEQVDGPDTVWVNPGDTVLHLQRKLGERYGLESVHIVQVTYSNQPHFLAEPGALVKFDPKCSGYKLYVSQMLDVEETDSVPFGNTKLASLIDRFSHVIMLKVLLPDTNASTLETLSIPALDLNQIETGASGERADVVSSGLRISPQPGANEELFGDQSNSEDSSLSDSDRTLVGDAPGDNIGLLSSSSNSPADLPMVSVLDSNEDEDYPVPYYPYQQPQEEMNWDDVESPSSNADKSPPNYYFKAQMVPIKPEDNTKLCNVLVDKRITLDNLKKHLEVIVGVPVEYFKVFRQHTSQEIEWSTLTDHLGSLKDEDMLVLRLGRVLKNNEYAFKVFHLSLPHGSGSTSGTELINFLFDWIVSKEQTVASAKKEILLQAKKQHMLNIPFSKCRLRKKAAAKTPTRIFLNDEKFADIIVPLHSDVYLQEFEGPEKTSSSELMIFARRWNPATLSLSPFHEVLVENRTLDDVKRAINEVSTIPLEFVEVAHIRAVSFPCDMNVLEVHSKLNWNPEDIDSYSLSDDGVVFFYRDSREEVKKLTMDEQKELSQSENKRLGRFRKSTFTSPRKEHGLKIYVDTSPKKEDESVVGMITR